MTELVGLPPAVLLSFGLAAFAGFFVSALVGVGGAMVLVPVLMFALSPAEAIAVAAPVMLASNAAKLFVYRRHLDLRAALLTSATAVPAAGVAALFTGVVSESALKAGVGLLILTSLVVQRFVKLSVKVGTRSLLGAGVVIGGVSGLCSAAGAPTAVTFKAYGLVKEGFVATVAFIAAAMQLSKIPTYVATGVFSAELWPLAGVLSLTSLLAVLLARSVQERLSAARFRVVLDGVLVVLSAVLIGDALLT